MPPTPKPKPPKRITEDMPGWRWWSMGDHTASRAHATKNPAPPRYRVVSAGRGPRGQKLVKAVPKKTAKKKRR